MQPGKVIPADCEDNKKKASFSLQMLVVNSRKQITNSEVLSHDFITTKHLLLANNPFVIPAKTIMTTCCFDEGNCNSAECEEENARTSGSNGSSDPTTSGPRRTAQI